MLSAMLSVREIVRQCMGALVLVAPVTLGAAVATTVLSERLAHEPIGFECIEDARHVSMHIVGGSYGCFGGEEHALDVSWDDSVATLSVPDEADATAQMPRDLMLGAVTRVLADAEAFDHGEGFSTQHYVVNVRWTCDGEAHEAKLESNAALLEGRTRMQQAVDAIEALRVQARGRGSALGHHQLQQ